MFKSIRWKLSILYFILVFIAMTIVGVFVSDRLEDYNLGLVKENLMLISNSTIMSVMPDENGGQTQEEIQSAISKIALPVGYNVYIIEGSNYQIVGATNESLQGKNAMEVLNSLAIMNTVSDGSVDIDVLDPADGVSMSKIYTNFIDSPDGSQRYIIYSTASLNSVYQSLRATTRIIVNAAGVALLVTLLVGFIISGSITTPINDLNLKASLIAKGDFSQRVETRSNDEIGMLGTTFNYLTKRLDHTLIEMSSEKSKLDAIINNMADGLMAVDENGFVILYNKSLLRILETKGIILYGNNLTQLSKELGLNITLTEIKRSMADEEVGSFVVEAKDDRVLRVSTAFYNDDSRRQTGFILLFQDITEAQRLEEMRKEFVANVSHELKTPITTIKTYAETLSGGSVDDPQMAQSFLETIEKEADRMTALVRDLLQLSHIDFKKTKWEITQFEVETMIKECIEHLKIYYTGKNQQIIFTNNGNPVVSGDRTKIKQVFVNIISNAVKYTPEDGVIRILLENEKDCAKITIADNGIGIPKQDVQRVFERFYRVDKGRSRQQGGTGLGLAIAKDIVEAHGGTILAESEIGEGSKFIIKLPHKNA